MSSSKKIGSALGWKLMERFGVQGSQFVLQILLARLLSPEHYGTLSLMIIFTTLANVFIQRGFNTALVQNKDVTEEDYSSVFWMSLGIAGIIYGILFASAPLIASFYQMPDLVSPFRVLCLVLFPGSLNAVQLAIVNRKMDFKHVFRSNVAAVIVSGVIGIVLALNGAGLWALVAQFSSNVVIACIVMWFTVKWRPKFVFNLKRIKILLSFGWKLMVSGLIDTLYQDLRTLVIGKKYNSKTLGHYNRGKQFPQFIINAVNNTVQSVMLSAMSAEQDHKDTLKKMMRNSITVSAYIIFPIMAGLAGVAEPLVRLLLTDKWLPCVPYLQIYCFTFAFYPVHSCNLQAINAVGRSDLFLKLEIIKKMYGIAALVIAVTCFDSPIAIALTGAITSILSSFVNASPSKKLIDYSYGEQMLDVAPSFVLSGVMFGAVFALPHFLALSPLALITLQIAIGVAIYIGGSIIFKLSPFRMLMGILRKKAHKHS